MHAQVNSRYVPQLQEVLQWPQSVGIVGGRPSSSLYFIGHQGQSVLFMDPHEVQDVRRSHTPSVLVAWQDRMHWKASGPVHASRTSALGRTVLLSLSFILGHPLGVLTRPAAVSQEVGMV